MTMELVSDMSNVVRFPGDRRERPSIELVKRLVPTRSLVNALGTENGKPSHDVQAGFAREFSYQARALEAALGRDEAMQRLREMVEAHLAQAADMCRAYQEAAARLMCLEIEAARMVRVPAQSRRELSAARGDLRGRAIAVRVVTDAALGAASAMTQHIGRDWHSLPASEGDPRQLGCSRRLLGKVTGRPQGGWSPVGVQQASRSDRSWRAARTASRSR